MADGPISPRRRVLLRAGPVLRTVTGAHKGRPYTRAVFGGPRRVQRGIGDRLGSHAACSMGHRATEQRGDRREYAFQAVGQCERGDR